MAMEREELESLVRQIISEVLAQSAPAPAPAPVQPGHQMEVRVHPDGTIVISPSGAGAAGAASLGLWDCDCIYTTGSGGTCGCPTCTCIDPPSACCCGACIEPPQQLLSATFESHTEEVFSRILEAEPMSRDQLVGHLWERVMKKLVHNEAVTFHAEQRGEGALPEPRGEAPGDAEPTS